MLFVCHFQRGALQPGPSLTPSASASAPAGHGLAAGHPGTVSGPQAHLLVPRRLNPSVLGACFGGGAKTPQVRAKAGALSPFVLNPSRCGQNPSPSSRPRCTPQPPPVLTGFSASFSLGEDSHSGGEGKGARSGPFWSRRRSRASRVQPRRDTRGTDVVR